MKVIVLSPQNPVKKEIETLISLFEEGLSIYHLRKPHYSQKKLRNYIDKIPKEYHNRIVIHSHHKLAVKYNLKGIHLSSSDRKRRLKAWLKVKSVKRKNPWITVSTSFHSISELDVYHDLYDYVFLSPVFDSISKKDYQSGFKEFTLTSATNRSNYNVVALGGLNEHNIDKAFNMGFWGCAFIGTIWTSDEPAKTFRLLKSTCKSYRNKTI